MKDFSSNRKLGILRHMTLQSGYKRDLWYKRFMQQTEKPKKLRREATAAEVNQRQKFAMATKFVAKIKDALKIGLANQRTIPSSYLLKHLLNGGITGEYPNLEIDYSKVSVSVGNLDPALNPVLTIDVNGSGNLSWLFDPYSNVWDTIYLLLFDAISNQVLYSDYAGNYLDLTGSFKIPIVKRGRILHVWVFTKKGKDTGDSEYFKVVAKRVAKN